MQRVAVPLPVFGCQTAETVDPGSDHLAYWVTGSQDNDGTVVGGATP